MNDDLLDDCERGLDQGEYIHFTGRQRMESAMNTLHGIVAGIVADENVNDRELAALTLWLGRHEEFIDRHPFSELIPRLQEVIVDRFISDEERSDVLWMCEKLSDRGRYYDEITADMQKLHGFLSGIVADRKINALELQSLSQWLDEHASLRACWPYDELETLIVDVLRDGQIDAREHEQLLNFFSEFSITPSRQAVGPAGQGATVIGVCAHCPVIAFAERNFCITGGSKRSTRDGLVEIISRRGGRWHKGLRNDTHYLLVGADGNPCWAYACYGRKIEDAVDRRKRGQKLLIIHEFDFWDAVEGAGR